MTNKIRKFLIIVFLETLFCLIFMFITGIPWYNIVVLWMITVTMTSRTQFSFTRKQQVVLGVFLVLCYASLQYYIKYYAIEPHYNINLERGKFFIKTLREKIKKNKDFKNIYVILHDDRKVAVYIVGDIKNKIVFEQLKKTVNSFLPFPVPVYIAEKILGSYLRY